MSSELLPGLLDRLAAGETPPADASVTTVPAPALSDGRRVRALVVGGTGWHVVAADVDPAWVAAQVAHEPIEAPLGARFLSTLADRVGAEPGVLDALLVAPPAPADPGLDLVETGPGEHPRVRRALAHRTDVRVWTTPDGTALLTLGQGVCGRWEVGVEVHPSARGRGLGTALAAAAPALVPQAERAWAQVAPANVASLRSFLAAGWHPVGAEVLFGPGRRVASLVQRL
ncbi:GNAT family N-acetyltransferase [Modestobacter italicus]|uniref:GNAT family N-acetyltransferase n=1 Tax=Modestobacter italicus (strain DSM 44449 / CECT 9708 / BC 501) TaxID=2732864 RepID=UPI001C959A8D|nr:GNAT family N-acetyltransferase [Modestobacter italicus]